ncbi:MAG TPA: hypothetical protein VFL14_10830 [Xanthomonadales bacterium]|nr:hypothetical protein [Xanthomonadales bacterium]
MGRGWLLSFAMAFAACLPGAASAGRLLPADLEAADAFQSVPAHQLLGEPADESLSFGVTLPTVYKAYTSPMDLDRNVMWARLADWTRVRHKKRLTGMYGAVVSAPSDLVEWSEKHGEFRDATGMNDGNIAERLAKHDAKNVRVVRIDRPGVPMLLVEADLSHLETLRAVYIATPSGTTRKLFYLPQRPWSPADDIVWARLRDSIAGGPVKDARPPR